VYSEYGGGDASFSFRDIVVVFTVFEMGLSCAGMEIADLAAGNRVRRLETSPCNRTAASCCSRNNRKGYPQFSTDHGRRIPE
jgi:hypothetical protein